MCLAIPRKIVDVLSDERDLAMVDVLGVRRRVDLGLGGYPAVDGPKQA